MSLTTSPTTANPAVRTVNGEELPAAGTYALDASHSQVGFAVRHLMVSKIRGRFSDFAGTVEIAENPLDSSVAVTIQTASIDTRDEQRDGHLRSDDFFGAEAHPTITYVSRGGAGGRQGPLPGRRRPDDQGSHPVGAPRARPSRAARSTPGAACASGSPPGRSSTGRPSA